MPSAQLSQGWKPTVSKLEHALGRGRQDLLHPHQLFPGAGLLGQLCSLAGGVGAGWSWAGLCCEAEPCCCGQSAVGDRQQVSQCYLKEQTQQLNSRKGIFRLIA